MSQKSLPARTAHFPAEHRRLSHPAGGSQGCTTPLCQPHPCQLQAGAVPSPAAHLNTCPAGLCVPLHSPTHHTTHPSHSPADAPSPVTQTTDLIFLFLNTQRSSLSAANPSEAGRETERSLFAASPPPQISLHILPSAVSSKWQRRSISHLPHGCEMVLRRGWGAPCSFWLHADGSNSTSFSFTTQSISPEAPKGVPWLAPSSETWGDTQHAHASPTAQNSELGQECSQLLQQHFPSSPSSQR